MRVLIVEDELKMAGLLRRGLVEEGHAADVATTGEDAVWLAQSHPYEAIVLDVMLPGLSGFETCRQLRNAGVWSPVLMLTARDGVEDRVAGLDVGADDYLTKPFSFAELLARLRALVRRGGGERPTELVVGTLRLDPASRRAWRGRTEISLSPKEFALLEAFMRPPRTGSFPAPVARARLGFRIREPLQRHRRLRALHPGESRSTFRDRVHRDRARSRLPAARE
jgi:two-component system OmpR family response regulator